MLKVVTANPSSVQADIDVRTAAQSWTVRLSMTETSLPVSPTEPHLAPMSLIYLTYWHHHHIACAAGSCLSHLYILTSGTDQC